MYIGRPRYWILVSEKDAGSRKAIDALIGKPGAPGGKPGTTAFVLKETSPWD